VSFGPSHAFGSSDFTLFQCARGSRVLATEMISVAVGWQIYDLTARPASLGYAGLWQFLPGLLLFLIAGHCADRFKHRSILIVCYALYALDAALLAAITLSNRFSLGAVYVLLAAAGVARAFSGPAAQALLPQLVHRNHFPRAVALGSTVFTGSTIVGPVLGGVLYQIAKGPTIVYLAAAVMYLGSLLLTVCVRPSVGKNAESSPGGVLAGFRYIWRRRVIFGCMSLDLFAVLFGGAVALLPVFAKDILHTGPWGLGLLRSASALGAVGMALRLARRPLEDDVGSRMLQCVALFGLATIVFGVSKNLLVSVVALVFMGAMDMISVVVRGILIQLATPPSLRGRVSAVNLLFTGASNQIGQFESGLTAQWFGTVPAVVLGGIGTLIVVAIWAQRFPEIRSLDNLVSTNDCSEDAEGS
jgi:MFS family permease